MAPAVDFHLHSSLQPRLDAFELNGAPAEAPQAFTTRDPSGGSRLLRRHLFDELVGPDPKTGQRARPENMGQRHIGRVAAGGDQDTADARRIVVADRKACQRPPR
jgi:hypothetical protein